MNGRILALAVGRRSVIFAEVTEDYFRSIAQFGEPCTLEYRDIASSRTFSMCFEQIALGSLWRTDCFIQRYYGTLLTTGV